MPTLKFTIKSVEFQYIGSEDEITNFISHFIDETMTIQATRAMVQPTGRTRKTVAEEAKSQITIELPLHSEKEVMEYVVSKPQFSHDLFEVQEHFYGRKFTSRKDGVKMYHKTLRQLKMIRKKIEEQYAGQFKVLKGEQRGQKRFVFERSPTQKATLFPTQQ